MANSLHGKVVLITGASSGFGEDAARLFAGEGCKVVLAARRLERLQALAEEIQKSIVQYFGELGAEVEVHRNDEITVEEIDARLKAGRLDRLVISPGPCSPSEAGISVAGIQHFAGKLPILGVCLGHQSIGQAFGGKIVRARQIMHGKTTQIFHNDVGVFEGLPSPFEATRYHSLVIEKATAPACLEVTAWTQNEDGTLDEIMGVRHRDFVIEGVQFHPESILTEHGHKMLANFMKMSRAPSRPMKRHLAAASREAVAFLARRRLELPPHPLHGEPPFFIKGDELSIVPTGEDHVPIPRRGGRIGLREPVFHIGVV